MTEKRESTLTRKSQVTFQILGGAVIKQMFNDLYREFI
jgi:hypothetical protein